MTGSSAPDAGASGERVFIRLGPPPEEPGQFVTDGARESYPPEVRARLEAETGPGSKLWICVWIR